MRLEGGGEKGRAEETGMAYGRNGPHLRGRHPGRRENTSSFLKDMELWNSLCSCIHTTILYQGPAGMRALEQRARGGRAPPSGLPRAPPHHLHGPSSFSPSLHADIHHSGLGPLCLMLTGVTVTSVFRATCDNPTAGTVSQHHEMC